MTTTTKAMMAQNLEEMGYEVRYNNRILIAIKKGKNKQNPNTSRSVFMQNELIKGKKAYYSTRYFKVIGTLIYENETSRMVDIVSA